MGKGRFLKGLALITVAGAAAAAAYTAIKKHGGLEAWARDLSSAAGRASGNAPTGKKAFGRYPGGRADETGEAGFPEGSSSGPDPPEKSPEESPEEDAEPSPVQQPEKKAGFRTAPLTPAGDDTLRFSRAEISRAEEAAREKSLPAQGSTGSSSAGGTGAPIKKSTAAVNQPSGKRYRLSADEADAAFEDMFRSLQKEGGKSSTQAPEKQNIGQASQEPNWNMMKKNLAGYDAFPNVKASEDEDKPWGEAGVWDGSGEADIPESSNTDKGRADKENRNGGNGHGGPDGGSGSAGAGTPKRTKSRRRHSARQETDPDAQKAAGKKAVELLFAPVQPEDMVFSS